MERNLVLPLNFTATIEKLEQLQREIKQEKNLYKKYHLLKLERLILQSSIDRYFYLNAN